MKRIETELMRLVQAFEYTAEAVIITDRAGRIAYANPAFEHITGFSREDAMNKTPNILQSGQYYAAFCERMWSTIRNGDTWAERVVNKRKDGTLVQMEATISPVKTPSGEIINFVAVMRDVTKHVELTDQLYQAQKMEAIGALAGGVAHDFNNLLTVVLGYSELLLSDDKSAPDVRDDLAKIYQAASAGADLVQRLLLFSRKTKSEPRPLDLNERIRRIRKMLTRTISKMIRIDLILADNLASINADPTQIDQILMNLVVNARDAMPQRGELTIHTSNTLFPAQNGRSQDSVGGGYVELTVSDTGHGMNKETLAHIFEPFFTTKAVGKGTGLGLAMVYGIVKRHNGLIRCFSEPGKGTVFRLYFPALVAHEEDSTIKTQELPRGGRETILFVDDEDPVRELGVRLLSKVGYTVISATDGRQALEMYEHHRDEIELVMMDIMMPTMNGIQCLQAIRRVNPAVKVIVASGYTETDTSETLRELGIEGVVSKPFNARRLLEAVRATLDAPGSPL